MNAKALDDLWPITKKIVKLEMKDKVEINQLNKIKKFELDEDEKTFDESYEKGEY